MADAVTTQTLFDGTRVAVMKFTNVSDGTGESNVVKVNVSTLSSYQGAACSGVEIDRVYTSTHGMEVDIKWAANTPVLCMTVPQNTMQWWDMRDFGGLTNNAGAGKNGNILFSTVDASAGDRYTIILCLRKIYG
jgi:hypothetical protein